MNLKRPREGRKVLILLFVFRKMHLKEKTGVQIFRVLLLFSFFKNFVSGLSRACQPISPGP